MPEDHTYRCDAESAAVGAGGVPGWLSGSSAEFETVWRSAPGAAVPGSDLAMSPAWRLFLLGDGSATRNMMLLTGGTVGVEVVETRERAGDPGPAPDGIDAVAGPWLVRRVWLTAEDGTRLSHAVSWWNLSQARRTLHDPAQPVGTNLARARRTFHREILSLFRVRSPALARDFGHIGACWGRLYRMWDQDEAVCLIGETYSPVLERYLGPVD